MNKLNSINPFTYSSEKKKFDSNAQVRKKNSVISPDKIYFFRTSLFTEKSKNFIQKLNSCDKNRSNFNSSNSINETNAPKLNSISTQTKTSLKLKKGKFYFSQNKNINKSDIEENQNSNIKEKKELSRNPIINKSSNDLINQKIVTNISHLQNENKSMTMDKRESNNNQNKTKKVNIPIKNLKKMNKDKVFSPLNNLINTNKNKQTIIVNYINQNHSIINLANAKSRQKQLPKEKTQKIETVHKIKYRLKSQKNEDKSKNKNNKNIISFAGITNKNFQKELKNLKSINNHYNMKSSSIFDENYYFSRYKLGNYYPKKNNRYGNIHSNFNVNTNNMKNTISTDEKLNSKRKNRISLYKRNIFC